SRGIAPRAIAFIFETLQQCSCWSVEVSVLEIYNERVRDLLAPGPGVCHVDVHEVRNENQGASFRCPDATRRQATSPEEALAALTEGMKRRETARTDMNHNSSRSHLIFTLATCQRDAEIGATLRGRLHFADLAGSERLKRSMSSDFHSPRGSSSGPGRSATQRSPRDQRREAGEINKSLSQLAMVIQRLTSDKSAGLQLVPYRDSMLTRLLAESFGGSSKTCLIITCSAQLLDREETRCSLEFGKRAKLVRNKAEINLEVAHEPSAIMEAFFNKKVEDLQREHEAVMMERELILADRAHLQKRLHHMEDKLSEAVSDVLSQQSARHQEVVQLEDKMAALERKWVTAVAASVDAQEASAAEAARLQAERQTLHDQLTEGAATAEALRNEIAEEVRRRQDLETSLRAQLVERQKLIDTAVRQAGELRTQIAELGKEKAADLARFEGESAAMRASWLE
ncbi:unnamed protein product, partial [Polarella glacialis]